MIILMNGINILYTTHMVNKINSQYEPIRVIILVALMIVKIIIFDNKLIVL